MKQFDAILIAGATASGKSAFALGVEKLLKRHGHGAAIVNVDSMQVYEELRVVSARPSEDEERQAEHFLYGCRNGSHVFSTRDWLDEVEAVLNHVMGQGRVPLLVGGTGLYFKALTEGLAHIPPISDDVRIKVRCEIQSRGSAVMHGVLAKVDPISADHIKAGDRQRISRALEVYSETGRALSDWTHEAHGATFLAGKVLGKVVLMPERAWLYDRINRRFKMMAEGGGVSEVRNLLAKNLPDDAQIMKAIGVPQLAAFLRDEIELHDAIMAAQQESRRYAKRQMTWFRNQMGEDWMRIDPSTQSIGGMCEQLFKA